MPKPNAMPRYACGIAKKRFMNGYEPATNSATTDSSFVSVLSGRISRNATNDSTAAIATASHARILPEVSGRSAVRFT
jgi:hypothetical protein